MVEESKPKTYVTRLDDGNVVVALRYPITYNQKTTEEITIRGDMSVADLEAMDSVKGEVRKTLALIAELSGIGMSALRKLKPVDYAEVQGVVSEVMGKEPPGTGAI